MRIWLGATLRLLADWVDPPLVTLKWINGQLWVVRNGDEVDWSTALSSQITEWRAEQMDGTGDE